MTVNPVPVLALSGVDVASGPAPDGSWPLMALSGAQVTWGRDDVLAQPSPARAAVAVFDPAGDWAATADLIGAPLTLRWTWAGETHVYFRGRVATVTVEPTTTVKPDGTTVDGATVALTATSLLTDLANRRPTDGSWPAETFAARRDRVAALLAGPVAAITTRPTWDTAPLAADTSPDGTAALEHLDRLWRNAGADRYAYDPDTQTIGWLGRRTFPATDAARLARSASRVGVYITGPSATGAEVAAPESIDAGTVQYAGGASLDQASRLTRVQLTYPGSVSHGFTLLVGSLSEASAGVRSLDVDTQHTDDTRALAAGSDVAALVAGEATGWTLEDMTWDTARTGGFDTVGQARLLLAGVERSGVFWLGGSWLPAAGIRPLFGVLGGSIAYRSGGWSVAWRNAPTSTTGTAAPVTWDDLDPSITWAEDTAAGFHPSVTYDDLRFVASGVVTAL